MYPLIAGKYRADISFSTNNKYQIDSLFLKVYGQKFSYVDIKSYIAVEGEYNFLDIEFEVCSQS